ncbi:MAG: hypothetical protein WC728_02535 [Elusimicrobiota bacterium]
MPELKQEEEERRGAGAAWCLEPAGAPSGVALGAESAPRMGASLANPGFLDPARVAVALSRILGGPATILGGLLTSRLGGRLVLAGMLALGGLLVLAGFKAIGLPGAKTEDPPMSGVFNSLPGALSSGIVLDKPKNRSLDWLAYANRGELAFEDGGPAKEQDAPAGTEQAGQEQKPPQAKVPDIPLNLGGLDNAAVEKAKLGLNTDGFSKKLTNDTGQMFAGGPGASVEEREAREKKAASLGQALAPEAPQAGQPSLKSRRSTSAVSAGKGSPVSMDGFQKLDVQKDLLFKLQQIGHQILQRGQESGVPATITAEEARSIERAVGLSQGAADKQPSPNGG